MIKSIAESLMPTRPSSRLKLFQDKNEGHELPFVSVGSKTIFWKPVRSGNYEVDCATGREYAENLLAFMRKNQNPLILRSVIQSMNSQDALGGVEIGFLTRLGTELLRP